MVKLLIATCYRLVLPCDVSQHMCTEVHQGCSKHALWHYAAFLCVERISEQHSDRLKFYLAKADTAGTETDRQRVLMQITQELCKRPGLNQAGFDMPTIYIQSLIEKVRVQVGRMSPFPVQWSGGGGGGGGGGISWHFMSNLPMISTSS